MTTSFLCQKEFKQISKLETRQLQTIYENVILVSEGLQTDIEIDKRSKYRLFVIMGFVTQE